MKLTNENIELRNLFVSYSDKTQNLSLFLYAAFFIVAISFVSNEKDILSLKSNKYLKYLVCMLIAVFISFSILDTESNYKIFKGTEFEAPVISNSFLIMFAIIFMLYVVMY